MDPMPKITLLAAEELAWSRPTNVTFQLPLALSERLDQLVESLERDGPGPRGDLVKQRTSSRKEVVAALLLAARPEELEDLVERYRQAKVGDAPLTPGKGRTVAVAAPAPGMRLTSDQRRERQRGERPTRRNRASGLDGERLAGA
jgi:hypothetical protein